MKIKEITSQNRRDFQAVYECESCRHERSGYGYDDSNFHENVIPEMTCEKCGKRAPSNYIARPTKYPASMTV